MKNGRLSRKFVTLPNRGWGTRAGGRRTHVFDCACPTQTCPRALCVLSMSHVGHAKEHAFACPTKNLTIWRAVSRLKFLKIGFLTKKYCNLTIKNFLQGAATGMYIF